MIEITNLVANFLDKVPKEGNLACNKMIEVFRYLIQKGIRYFLKALPQKFLANNLEFRKGIFG